jgi:hypothetical protein
MQPGSQAMHVVGSISPSWALLPLYLALRMRRDLKLTIHMTPSTILKGDDKKYEINETDIQTARIGWGDAAQCRPWLSI